jgi:hypothetical protein
MTDPLPTNEPASGYNTELRPRPRRKWFKFLKAPKDMEGFYTPFWPLLIVFMSFMVLLVYEISFLRSRSMSLHMQISHLTDGVQKANGQLVFIQGLHGDLATMAPSHPAAAQILREFFPPEVETPPMPADSTSPKPAGAESAAPPATAPPHP